MKKRDMVKALNRAGAHLDRQGGEHEIWYCQCGSHQTQVPRSRDITPGVVRSVLHDMACHKKGWLK